MTKAEKLIHREIKAEGNCGMIVGDETIEELIYALSSPQGIEYCTARNLPSIKAWQALTREERECDDEVIIKVDAGYCRADSPSTIVLVGDTDCRILIDTDLSYTANVILLHGATARLTVMGYSVVAVHQAEGCAVHVKKDETAVVMM